MTQPCLRISPSLESYVLNNTWYLFEYSEDWINERSHITIDYVIFRVI